MTVFPARLYPRIVDILPLIYFQMKAKLQCANFIYFLYLRVILRDTFAYKLRLRSHELCQIISWWMILLDLQEHVGLQKKYVAAAKIVLLFFFA